MGVDPEERLAELENHGTLVARRDDLTIELIALYNLTGRSAQALPLLQTRRFHPWEGGEGLVSGQYIAAHLLLGLEALKRADSSDALAHFGAARRYPQNLGEGKHLLTRETHLDYYTGMAHSLGGCAEQAKTAWRRAAAGGGEMDMFALYRALALRELGEEAAARNLLEHLREFAEAQMHRKVKIDYFATSLPNFLLFEDDLQKRNRTECLFLRGLANLGLGYPSDAAEDLRQVIELDRNHLFAKLELDRINGRLEKTPS
jgi:tetratricopeptide (TPR) repeat protein